MSGFLIEHLVQGVHSTPPKIQSLRLKLSPKGGADCGMHLDRAPMSFFHTTPMGRIINRLTKDTSDVDKMLADFASFFLRSSLQLVTTVVLIGFYVPFALAALIPILLCFYLLYAYFQVQSAGLVTEM